MVKYWTHEKKEIIEIIETFFKEYSCYGEDDTGIGNPLYIRKRKRKDNSIYINFGYIYDDDPYWKSHSSVIFSGHVIIDPNGELIDGSLGIDKKGDDAYVPSNFKGFSAYNWLISKSKVQEYIKSKGCNISNNLAFGDAVNKIIKELLDKAVERAKANNRKTVQAKDI